MEIAHRRDNLPVSVSTDMQDLLVKATDQNFVPVVDDKGDFIGIVTRRAIMRYFLEEMRPRRRSRGKLNSIIKP